MIERLNASYKPDLPVAADSAQKKKLEDATQQFESLLITELLRSARGGSEGWLGTGGDQAGMQAAQYAEEMFARALSAGGGLGLGRSIAASIESSGQSSEVNP